MHVMCENNEKYDCKTARWIQKTMQCMWILNINDKKKKKNRLVKYLKTKNFSVSINQETDSIDRKSGKIRFLKNKAF